MKSIIKNRHAPLTAVIGVIITLIAVSLAFSLSPPISANAATWERGYATIKLGNHSISGNYLEIAPVRAEFWTYEHPSGNPQYNEYQVLPITSVDLYCVLPNGEKITVLNSSNGLNHFIQTNNSFILYFSSISHIFSLEGDYIFTARVNSDTIPGEHYCLYTEYPPEYNMPNTNEFASVTYTYATAPIVPLPPTPSKVGYDFVGWYYNEELTQIYDNAPLHEGVTLYPKFAPTNYQIIYNLNGGSLTGQKTNYNIETVTYTLPVPVKNGFTFGGWYSNAGFNGHEVISIVTGSTGDCYLYAKWVPINYNINLNLNGGALENGSYTYTAENSYRLPIPERKGYKFLGWFESPTLGGVPVDIIPAGSTGDRTFYAKFEIMNYTITYHAVDAKFSGAETYTYDKAYTLPVPVKDGHTFEGWYLYGNFSGSAVTEIPLGSTGNKTFYAKFNSIYYIISFTTDGNVFKQIQVPYGAVLDNYYLYNTDSKSTVPLYTNKERTAAYNTSQNIYADTVLYADTTFELYCTLTYSVDGELSVPVVLEYNTPLKDYLKTPVLEGYTFAGWYYDKNFLNAVSKDGKITSNIVLYAKFTDGVTEPNNVAEFFKKWWWCFVLPVFIVGMVFLVRFIIKKRGKKV